MDTFICQNSLVIKLYIKHERVRTKQQQYRQKSLQTKEQQQEGRTVQQEEF